MEGYHPIVAHALTWNYLAVFAAWYLVYGTFAYNFNYEGTRGGFFLPLYALADDLYLQLPGRKAAFIRKQVDEALDRGHGGGYLGGGIEDDWSYENVRKNDLYAEVGAAMLPGALYALVVTAPLLYPVYFWAWKSFFPTWVRPTYVQKIPRSNAGDFHTGKAFGKRESFDSPRQNRTLAQLSNPRKYDAKEIRMENNENAVQQGGVQNQNEGAEGAAAQVETVDAGTPVVEGEVITATEVAAEAPAEAAPAAEEAPVAEAEPVAEGAGAEPVAETAEVAESTAAAVVETPAAEAGAVVETATEEVVAAAVEAAPEAPAAEAVAEAPAEAVAETAETATVVEAEAAPVAEPAPETPAADQAEGQA